MEPDRDNNRVLIVDDQDEIHQDFNEMLGAGRARASTDELAAAFVTEEDRSFLPDFEILHAGSGEEACRIVETAQESDRPIAAAYVDIRMPPGIDGIETIRRIRRIDRDIEIVIMTAYTDKSLPEIIHDMELLHKVLYIRKPFAREEIQQITLSLVGKWNVERALAEKQVKLASSNQRLEAVLNATGDAMAMYDEDGRLVFANEGYEKLLDLSEGELKEISPEELAARVALALRRQSPPAPFRIGELILDRSKRRVTLAGRPLRLTATEYRLLHALSLGAGGVTSYETLLRWIWGDRGGGNLHALRSAVARLRHKLGDDAKKPRYVIGERGLGYYMPEPDGA